MKRLLVQACYSTGLFSLAARVAPSGSFLVLMYHRLGIRPDPFVTPLSVAHFKRQIEYIRGVYRLDSIENLVGSPAAGGGKRRPGIAITFDDCFDDFYREAYPFLKSLGIPATVFVSTGFVDTDRAPWTDDLGFVFRETAVAGACIELADREIRLSWRDTEGKAGAFREAKAVLKNLGEDARERAMQTLREQLAVSARNPSRILNSAQIREMSEGGINFGAHTVNHVILSRVPEDTAKREIEESKRQLEAITGVECAGFCYPNGEAGDFTPAIKEMARWAGFSYACTVLEGANGPETDPYELKRLWTSERRLPLFAARLARTALKKQNPGDRSRKPESRRQNSELTV